MNKWDKGIFFSFIGLVVFGLVMMSSMSISSSFDVTGQNDFYFWRHFRYIIIGLVLFVCAYKFPVQQIKPLAIFIFVAAIFLQIFTLFFGQDYGTVARLWLKIGFFSFQPVEVVKLSVVIFLASLFASQKYMAQSFERGLIPFALAMGAPCIILVIQSDFGSLLVIMMTAIAIYFASGANLKHFFGGLSIVGVGGIVITLLNPYILHRIKVFLDPSLDPLNTGFQIKQALIAIGSGGIFGKGFQNSIQKFDYLPEVQSDTIFSAISEEMGFLRIVLLLSVYLFIAYRGLQISRATTDDFERLLAFGITVWIVGQAFINIAVNLALLPNTGITLPLISYGGSSMIITCIAFGILLQISKSTSKHLYRRW